MGASLQGAACFDMDKVIAAALDLAEEVG